MRQKNSNTSLPLLPSGDYFRQIEPIPKNASCLFLDRDGIIIHDTSYISDPDDVILCEGIDTLIAAALTRSYVIIIVTNQSGIGRGFFDWHSFERVQERMLDLLIQKNNSYTSPVHAVVACPHHPKEGIGSYRTDPLQFRKPAPGMLNYAIDIFDLDRQTSIMLGNQEIDVIAGINANLSMTCLVDLQGRHAELHQPNSSDPTIIKLQNMDPFVQISDALFS